jgi:hypothetical protein
MTPERHPSSSDADVAETLGFSSVEEMNEHQQWLIKQKEEASRWREIDRSRFEDILVGSISTPVISFQAVREHAVAIYKTLIAMKYVFPAPQEDVTTNWAWEIWDKRWSKRGTP